MIMQDAHCPNREPVNFISRLQASPFAGYLNTFFYSPLFPVFIGALALIANLFAAELAVYCIYILIGILISLFGRDYLPIIPIVVCSYIAPSVNNNPGRNETSIFFGATGVFILCLAAIFVVSLILRLVLDPQIGRAAFFAKKRTFLPGILALGAAYLLAGAFSGHYWDHGYRNLLFAALQFLSIFLLYYILCGAVRWETAPKNHLAWTGLCIGFVLLGEILGIYLTQDIIVNGEVLRELICTGWGHYNNIGVLLAMMIPFAFQLACVKKNSWIYYLCGALFLIGVFVTCSRASILFSCCAYAASCLVVLFRSRNRRVGLITNVISIVVVVSLILIFREHLVKLISSMLANTDSVSVRQEGYRAGIAQYQKYPIFGGTFYPLDFDLYEYSNVEAFTAFFPARWHNTFVQLMASAGMVGFLAYLAHRWQTIRFVFRKPTVQVLCIAISLGTMLLCSLLDCHFFNIGPTLIYSIALAFAEHGPENK